MVSSVLHTNLISQNNTGQSGQHPSHSSDTPKLMAELLEKTWVSQTELRPHISSVIEELLAIKGFSSANTIEADQVRPQEEYVYEKY